MPLKLMIHYCFRDDFSHRSSGCQTVADKTSSNVHSQLVTTDMNTRKVLKRNKAKLNVHFANSLCKEYFSYKLDASARCFLFRMTVKQLAMIH